MNKAVDKPWGYEVIWARTSNYIGRTIVIEPNQSFDLQHSEKKEETIYVLEGLLHVWDTDNVNEYKVYGTGSAFQVTPNQIHTLGASDEKVKLIEVSTPEHKEQTHDYSR